MKLCNNKQITLNKIDSLIIKKPDTGKETFYIEFDNGEWKLKGGFSEDDF